MKLETDPRGGPALALVPIAIGHALAMLVALGAFLVLDPVAEPHWLRRLAGLVLIGCAV